MFVHLVGVDTDRLGSIEIRLQLNMLHRANFAAVDPILQLSLFGYGVHNCGVNLSRCAGCGDGQVGAAAKMRPPSCFFSGG